MAGRGVVIVALLLVVAGCTGPATQSPADAGDADSTTGPVATGDPPAGGTTPDPVGARPDAAGSTEDPSADTDTATARPRPSDGATTGSAADVTTTARDHQPHRTTAPPTTGDPAAERAPTLGLTANETAERRAAERSPFETWNVTVGVDDAAVGDRSVRGVVRRALAYWNGQAGRHATYPAQFVYAPDAEDPDVVVRFRAGVSCSDEGDELGCAPVLGPDVRVDGAVPVEVQTGFTDGTTLEVLKHEFGHVLGLDHDDAPQPLMAPVFEDATTLPATDAVDRPFPWQNETLAVYVAVGDLPEANRSTVRAQVRHALDYYATGADGHVPSNRSFATVSDPGRADVVVRFSDRRPCGPGDGSCGQWRGIDTDRDGSLEWHTGANVTLSGVEPAVVGWHVGYWLGYALGAASDADLPPPFRDAGYDERRNWWKDEKGA